MKKLTDILPLSRTDKLCLLLLALCFLAPHIAVLAIDSSAERHVEADKPTAEVVAAAPPIDCTPLVDAIEASREAAQVMGFTEKTVKKYVPFSGPTRKVSKATLARIMCG